MKTLKPEQAFLFLAFLFGLGFLLLSPPFQPPDEAFHLFRSWEISQGKWQDQTKGGMTHMEVPKSFVDFLQPFQSILYHPRQKTSAHEILEFRHRPLEAASTQDFPFVSTVPHAFLPYLPQTLAVLLGRTMDASPFWILYLGRLLNFLTWLSLTYVAIRRLPIYQWVVTLLALSPMAIHQATSLSPDAMVNSLAFLAIAEATRFALLPESLPSWRGWGTFLGETFFLSLSKLVYIGHSGLILLFTKEKLGSIPRRVMILGGCIGLQILVLAWFFHGPAVASRPESNFQIHWILENPLAYFEILTKSLGKLGRPLLIQYVGVFGHLDTPLPQSLALSYLGFLALAVFFDQGNPRAFKWTEKFLLWSIALLEILAIFTSVFVTWTRPGISLILGVQGRYFIPILPLVLLPLYRSSGNRTPKIKSLGMVCLYFSAMVLVVALFVMKNRFY